MACKVLTPEQQKLVEDNMKLVPYFISRYYGPDKVYDDDFMSIGYLALCQSAAAYEKGRGSFSTLVAISIRHEIAKEGKRMFALKRSLPEAPISLDSEVWNDDSADTWYDILADQSVDVEGTALSNVFCDSLRPILPLYFEYQEMGVPMKDFAEHKHLSRQRIHEIMKKEYRHARVELADTGIAKEFNQEYNHEQIA